MEHLALLNDTTGTFIGADGTGSHMHHLNDAIVGIIANELDDNESSFYYFTCHHRTDWRHCSRGGKRQTAYPSVKSFDN